MDVIELTKKAVELTKKAHDGQRQLGRDQQNCYAAYGNTEVGQTNI